MRNISSEKKNKHCAGYEQVWLSGTAVISEKGTKISHQMYSCSCGELHACGQFENVLLVEVFRVGSIIAINLLSGTAKV